MLLFISTIVILLIALGIFYRKERQKHIPIMLIAFSIDMSLLLYIELTRHAIKTAVTLPHPFIIFHIIVSVIVVVLYLIQIYLGFKILKTGTGIPKHRIIGIIFIILRLTNFTTSFFISNFKV